MADAVTTQIITDTPYHTWVKLTNVSDGTGETNVLKVNAASLNAASRLVTVTSGAAPHFKIGETVVITANSTNTARATVADVNDARTIYTLINVADANGLFTAAASIVGQTSATTKVQTGAIANAALSLTLTRLIYNVTQSAAVGIYWEATPNTVAVVLTGTGTWDLVNQGVAIPNVANAATGNLGVTTYDFIAGTTNTEFKSTYTILLEVKKASGYTTIQYEKNNSLGFVNYD